MIVSRVLFVVVFLSFCFIFVLFTGKIPSEVITDEYEIIHVTVMPLLSRTQTLIDLEHLLSPEMMEHFGKLGKRLSRTQQHLQIKPRVIKWNILEFIPHSEGRLFIELQFIVCECV